MNTEKRAHQVAEKINKIVADKSQVLVWYHTRQDAVQAELRLHREWKISVPVDVINYPRDISGQNGHLWGEMRRLEWEITQVSLVCQREIDHVIRINERTKTGPPRRAEAKNLWLIEEVGKQFITDYRAATSKRNLAAIRKNITDLQAQQKALLPKLRESNSLYLAGKKSGKAARAAANAEALKSGRFWEADESALKNYFHPPFNKNYIADVSEKWRACLILECESVSYRAGYNNEWRHKLSATGEAYLCGIDDNGDEWGHRCRVDIGHDQYGNGDFEATVEDAMSELFEISAHALSRCERQGDLLFCPEPIPPETELHPQETWTPRESHNIASPSLQRNGRYFRAADDIQITHTSHAAVTLPAGEYRLYPLQVADAD